MSPSRLAAASSAGGRTESTVNATQRNELNVRLSAGLGQPDEAARKLINALDRECRRVHGAGLTEMARVAKSLLARHGAR